MPIKPAEAQAFIRQLQVRTKHLSAEGAAAAMRAAAAAARARVLREQSARSGGTAPSLTQVVDGVRGAPDAAIRAGGTVFLDWNYLEEAVRVVVEDLRERVPKVEGDLSRGVLVLVDGAEADPGALPKGAQEATVVSTVPYARRIEVGRGKTGPFSVKGFGLFEERAAQLGRRLAGLAVLRFAYIDLEGGYRGQGLRRGRDEAVRAGNARLARSADKAIARGADRVRYPAIRIREIQA